MLNYSFLPAKRHFPHQSISSELCCQLSLKSWSSVRFPNKTTHNFYAVVLFYFSPHMCNFVFSILATELLSALVTKPYLMCSASYYYFFALFQWIGDLSQCWIKMSIVKIFFLFLILKKNYYFFTIKHCNKLKNSTLNPQSSPSHCGP